MAGLDLVKHRPAVSRPRSVPEVDLSRFAGYQAAVPELPALMERRGRDHFRALVQFIKDWNYWVADRAEMLAGEPSGDADPFHLACIAAVVHALAARDSVEVPEWVHRHRAEPPRLISGHSLDTNYGRLIASEAPPVCARHGVYFEAEMLLRGIPAAP